MLAHFSLPLVMADHAACQTEVRAWFSAHGSGLLPKRLGLKQITTRLPLLLKCFPSNPRVALIDVGAGIHGLEDHWISHASSLHEDDSDALWLLGGFKHRAEVHAFEAHAKKAAELRDAAATRSFTQNFTASLHVHTQGVGAVPHTARLKQCGGPNQWTIDGVGWKGIECRLGSELSVTTIDAFAVSLSAPLLYIKVDVEGGELDIVRGMERVLREKRVPLMSFEYASGWHKHFLLRRPLTEAEKLEAGNSSLRHFSSQMSTYGYDTYLINAGGKGTGVVLIPVYGRFWHDDFEVCFHRDKVYGSYGLWCWNDVLVVLRDSQCVKTVLFGEILPATKGQGRRGLVWGDSVGLQKGQSAGALSKKHSLAAFPACASL